MPHGGPNHDPFGNPITPGGGNVGSDPNFGGNSSSGLPPGVSGPTVNVGPVRLDPVSILFDLLSRDGGGGGGGGGGGVGGGDIAKAAAFIIPLILSLMESSKLKGETKEAVGRQQDVGEELFRRGTDFQDIQAGLFGQGAGVLTDLLSRGPRGVPTPPLSFNPFAQAGLAGGARPVVPTFRPEIGSTLAGFFPGGGNTGGTFPGAGATAGAFPGGAGAPRPTPSPASAPPPFLSGPGVSRPTAPPITTRPEVIPVPGGFNPIPGTGAGPGGFDLQKLQALLAQLVGGGAAPAAPALPPAQPPLALLLQQLLAPTG